MRMEGRIRIYEAEPIPTRLRHDFKYEGAEVVRPNLTCFFGFNPIFGPIFGFKQVGLSSGSKNGSTWVGLTSKRVQSIVQPWTVTLVQP